MVAEMVDAVIGIDTHRDSHEVEIADPRGTPIATMRISNDTAGFTQLLATVAELAPGPRLAVSLEGSRSYGIGLARAPHRQSSPSRRSLTEAARTSARIDEHNRRVSYGLDQFGIRH